MLKKDYPNLYNISIKHAKEEYMKNLKNVKYIFNFCLLNG